MPAAVPPALPVDDLKFSAKIDYVSVTNGGIKIPLPPIEGKAVWVQGRKGAASWSLTIHDPSLADITAVVDHYENPIVMGVEISVDLMPKNNLLGAERRRLLETTFKAVSARFRPEDEALWAYGKRGAVNHHGMPIEPLERRFARVGEELIYGHRGEFMQAKLYLKTIDQHVVLPETEQCVRLELALRRGACMDDRIGLGSLSDLVGYKYRAQFTKHFRIIAEPQVRKLRGLTADEYARRERRMWRAWRTAGIGKFAIAPDLPLDTRVDSAKNIKTRQRAQLPYEDYKLMRDQRANAKIGSALMNLERRMTQK